MKPIHKLDKRYDGGRFAPSHNGWFEGELDEPSTNMCVRLAALMASQDPEDRREAQRVVYLLGRKIYCPDGIWVVKSKYLPDKNGKRWSDREVIWSAHLTKKEAEAWHRFWSDHWSKKERNDYGILPVQQQNNVPLHYLRHPDAAAGCGVE